MPSNFFERVLFPTDFSLYNIEIFNYLGALRSSGTKELHLLSIVSNNVGPNVADILVRDNQSKLDNLISSSSDLPFKIEGKVMTGEPGDVILQYMEEHSLTLIQPALGGGHGNDFFVGDVTRRVVIMTPKPILIMRKPSGEDTNPFERLMQKPLIPITADHVGHELLLAISKFPNKNTDEVVFINITDENANLEEVETNVRKMIDADYVGRPYKLIVDTGNISRLILETCKTEDTSLIVITSDGEDFFEWRLLDSIALDIIRRAQIPILYIPYAWLLSTLTM